MKSHIFPLSHEPQRVHNLDEEFANLAISRDLIKYIRFYLEIECEYVFKMENGGQRHDTEPRAVVYVDLRHILERVPRLIPGTVQYSTRPGTL